VSISHVMIDLDVRFCGGDYVQCCLLCCIVIPMEAGCKKGCLLPLLAYCLGYSSMLYLSILLQLVLEIVFSCYSPSCNNIVTHMTIARQRLGKRAHNTRGQKYRRNIFYAVRAETTRQLRGNTPLHPSHCF
jgi:hypothetical protein